MRKSPEIVPDEGLIARVLANEAKRQKITTADAQMRHENWKRTQVKIRQRALRVAAEKRKA